MTKETEQKIIDAALKVFAEKGYAGATTMDISERAGFSEKTLFRKFETKQNLFDRTIDETGRNMLRDFDKYVLVDKEFENPRDVLESVVNNIRKVGDNYFEYFHLSLRERTRIAEPFMAEFNFKLGLYLEKNIPHQKLDYMTLGLTISSFMYMVVTESHMGRNAIDMDSVLEKFIDNTLICIKS
jgi:TetR/AcrR family transcriptional regulator